MSLASGRLVLALLTLSCAPLSVTPPTTSPEALQSTPGDSAALASLDSFVVASLSRSNCPVKLGAVASPGARPRVGRSLAPVRAAPAA